MGMACRANSVNADQIESLVYQRLREAVSRPKVLRDVVARINAPRNENVGPLREELDALTKALARIEATKEKYFKLYEGDGIDTDSLLGHLEELKKEAATSTARKAAVEAEIRAGTAAPISFEVVQETMRRFNQVLATAPPEQKKTLLQLIEGSSANGAEGPSLCFVLADVTEDRKIDKVEIGFDESVQEYFMGEPNVA